MKKSDLDKDVDIECACVCEGEREKIQMVKLLHEATGYTVHGDVKISFFPTSR